MSDCANIFRTAHRSVWGLVLAVSLCAYACVSSADKPAEVPVAAVTGAPEMPKPAGVPSALIGLGVQAGSAVGDYAHAVVDDGVGGAYIGHLVMRDSMGILPTRPGDQRLVLEGAEGVYLSHYDADYQRVSRVILDDIHHIDGIARHQTSGELYIAGSEHFYPKKQLRTKLRISHYEPARARLSTGLEKQLVRRLPRKLSGHRIQDITLGPGGDIYIGVTLMSRPNKAGHVRRQMAIARITPKGKVRWYDALDVSDDASSDGGTDDGDSIAALAISPKGQLIVVGHTRGKLATTDKINGGLDMFVAAFDIKSGALVWHRRFGSSERDVAHDVVVTSDGAIVIVGATRGQMFVPGRGGDDAVIIALAEDGNPTWSEQLGTARDDLFRRITVTNKQVLLATGETSGQLALERPSADRESTDKDVLVAAYSRDGLRSWIVQLGTDKDDSMAGAATAKGTGTHVLFDTTGAFDRRDDAADGSGKGNQDLVLVRLRE